MTKSASIVTWQDYIRHHYQDELDYVLDDRGVVSWQKDHIQKYKKHLERIPSADRQKLVICLFLEAYFQEVVYWYHGENFLNYLGKLNGRVVEMNLEGDEYSASGYLLLLKELSNTTPESLAEEIFQGVLFMAPLWLRHYGRFFVDFDLEALVANMVEDPKNILELAEVPASFFDAHRKALKEVKLNFRLDKARGILDRASA